MSAEKLNFPFEAPPNFAPVIEYEGEAVEIGPDTVVLLEFPKSPQYNHIRLTHGETTIHLRPGNDAIEAMKSHGYTVVESNTPDEKAIDSYNLAYSDDWKQAG